MASLDYSYSRLGQSFVARVTLRTPTHNRKVGVTPVVLFERLICFGMRYPYCASLQLRVYWITLDTNNNNTPRIHICRQQNNQDEKVSIVAIGEDRTSIIELGFLQSLLPVLAKFCQRLAADCNRWHEPSEAI